jgi:hypothetical protein
MCGEITKLWIEVRLPHSLARIKPKIRIFLPFMPPIIITVIDLPLWCICIGATANHIKRAQVKLILSGDFPDCGATPRKKTDQSLICSPTYNWKLSIFRR